VVRLRVSFADGSCWCLAPDIRYDGLFPVDAHRQHNPFGRRARGFIQVGLASQTRIGETASDIATKSILMCSIVGAVTSLVTVGPATSILKRAAVTWSAAAISKRAYRPHSLPRARGMRRKILA
jgi:hypothetical protein